MASNPYGIAPVDVGGLLGIVEQKRRTGIEDMLRSRQIAQEDEKLAAARDARKKQSDVDALFTGEKLPEPGEVFRAGGAEAGFEYAKSYAEMKKGEREAAKARVDGLARVGMSLRNLPYPQRRAALEQQADQIASVTGLSREQVLGFDPSDAGIDGIITQSMDVKDQFDRIDKDRRFKMDERKFAFDRTKAADESARGWAGVQTARANAGKLQMVQVDDGQGGSKYVMTDGRGGFAPAPAGIVPPQSSTRLRPVPAAAAQGIVENRSAVRKIDEAIAAVEKNPKAFGLKNYLPDAYIQRADAAGVDPRAKVADIGSLTIHQRSGAAVTAAEFPRLAPFIPQATDDAATAVTKLKNLRNNLELLSEELESAYSPETGYKPIQTPGNQRVVRVGSVAEARSLPKGTVFMTPDGRTKVR